jgi:hypothetical protein
MNKRKQNHFQWFYFTEIGREFISTSCSPSSTKISQKKLKLSKKTVIQSRWTSKIQTSFSYTQLFNRPKNTEEEINSVSWIYNAYYFHQPFPLLLSRILRALSCNYFLKSFQLWNSHLKIKHTKFAWLMVKKNQQAKNFIQLQYHSVQRQLIFTDNPHSRHNYFFKHRNFYLCGRWSFHS